MSVFVANILVWVVSVPGLDPGMAFCLQVMLLRWWWYYSSPGWYIVTADDQVPCSCSHQLEQYYLYGTREENIMHRLDHVVNTDIFKHHQFYRWKFCFLSQPNWLLITCTLENIFGKKSVMRLPLISICYSNNGFICSKWVCSICVCCAIGLSLKLLSFFFFFFSLFEGQLPPLCILTH